MVPLQLFRDHLQFFTIFFYVCLLSISSTVAPNVIITAEPPGKTETSAKFLLYGVESFDTVTPGQYEGSYESNFNSTGYQSSSQGPYNNASPTQIRGVYSLFAVKENHPYFRVGLPGGRHLLVIRATWLELKSIGPFGLNYFGFYAYLRSPLFIRFYFKQEIIFTLKLQDIVKGLTADNTKYFDNPNPELKGQKQDWPYVFVNVFFEGATFNALSIHSHQPPLETDVHTVGTYIEKGRGKRIPVITKYTPPTENPMVAANVPGVAVRIEQPRKTDTSVRLAWSAREDFDGVPEQTYVTQHTLDFEPKGVVQGTYSAPFDILPNTTLAGAGSSGRYFSTTDSLLTLAVTGGKKPNVFGIYLKLNPLNRHSTLEFFLNGGSIFVLNLADVLGFIQSKPKYLGNPAPKPQPGAKASTERFVFVDIIFYKVEYDAIRIRYFSGVGGPVGAVASDNHIVGSFLGKGKSVKVPIKTKLKQPRLASST